MIEKIPDSKPEKTELDIQSEQEYFDMVLDYALDLGWVKKEEKEVLIEKYLKPIYQEYTKIIKELGDEGDVTDEEMKKAVEKMNLCLEATRRIGATDPANIIRTIDDLRRMSGNIYVEYAIASLRIIISEVLYRE